MERFVNTHFGLRDLDKAKHWCSDVENFNINKTTFINLGGNGTINEAQANGRCARVERMMGLKAKGNRISSTYQDIDIIAFVYGRNSESETVGKLTSEEVSNYVDKLFLPLFIDDNKNRVSTAMACKNFSKIVFYSHCYGSQVVNEFMADLNKKLKTYGYTKDEIEEIFSQTIHITYSPLQVDSWLPCVSINSFTDSFNFDNQMHVWFKRKYGYDLNGVALDFEDKAFCSHVANKKNCHKVVSVFTSRLLNVNENVGNKVIDEHASDYLDLDFNWQGCKKAMGAKNAECVSRLIGYALSWAGARSLQAERENKLVPLNLDELYMSLQDVLKLYNENELGL